MDASQGQHRSHRQAAPPPAPASQYPLHHLHPYSVYQPPLNPQPNPPKKHRSRRKPHGGPSNQRPPKKRSNPETQRPPVPYGYGQPIYHPPLPDAVAETYGGSSSTDEVSGDEPYDSYLINNERGNGGDDSHEQWQQVLEKLDNLNAQVGGLEKKYTILPPAAEPCFPTL
ncbi:hypothetical protein FGLOB1_14124 [Fusarium globosum]|uniref:Uncharacterized protein n=1 Tax=Fusarium globosum TaxID=78864 RepID=A0A8H6CWR4_9HYPO|nr:hypothetical protein FGLOB1_14124 [Fusarium globosum]